MNSTEGFDLAFAEHFYWTSRRAEQGCAEAQNDMGEFYAKGQGVAQDYGKAAEWYRKAAQNGHKEAREWLTKRGLKW